jgi:hypothetical protein
VIIEYSSVHCLDPVAVFRCPYLFCCWVQTVIQFEKLCALCSFFNLSLQTANQELCLTILRHLWEAVQRL